MDEARRFMDELREAGVDYEDVTGVLEKEGVQKFADSFNELLEEVKSKRVARSSVRANGGANIGEEMSLWR